MNSSGLGSWFSMASAHARARIGSTSAWRKRTRSRSSSIVGIKLRVHRRCRVHREQEQRRASCVWSSRTAACVRRSPPPRRCSAARPCVPSPRAVAAAAYRRRRHRSARPQHHGGAAGGRGRLLGGLLRRQNCVQREGAQLLPRLRRDHLGLRRGHPRPDGAPRLPHLLHHDLPALAHALHEGQGRPEAVLQRRAGHLDRGRRPVAHVVRRARTSHPARKSARNSAALL